MFKKTTSRVEFQVGEIILRLNAVHLKTSLKVSSLWVTIVSSDAPVLLVLMVPSRLLHDTVLLKRKAWENSKKSSHRAPLSRQLPWQLQPTVRP